MIRERRSGTLTGWLNTPIRMRFRLIDGLTVRFAESENRADHVLPQIQVPVQIIAGAGDAVVPLTNTEFLYQRLAHSRLDIVDAGHFAWEDAANEYAALIASWWDEGHTMWPARNGRSRTVTTGREGERGPG